MTSEPGLLLVTGGHRFDEPALTALINHAADRIGCSWEHARQPEASALLRPEHAGRWRAIVLHDLPGLTLGRGAEPVPHEPPADVVEGVLALLAAGQGLVATHHALAGWPTWDAWAHILGGRFLYAPGALDGRPVPASGYRLDTYLVEVVDPVHPVCDGVDPFAVTDELYLCPVLEQEVTPLLATTATISPDTMLDTYLEVSTGVQVAASPQPASQLLGWANQRGPSRIVYLLPGHEPATLTHPCYRRLVANACSWVAAG